MLNLDQQLAKPTENQIKWQENERMMFVCIDPATWQGREYDNHSTPLKEINPSQLDARQWCETALLWGARTILFVAKHTGGFCWWQTQTSTYGIKETSYKEGKGDVLKELSEACKQYGLGLAIYVYPGDDNWGAYNGGGGRTLDPQKQEEYNEVYRQQLTEVLTQYGEIVEIWFDGNIIIPVGDIIEKYAPNAMCFQSPHATIRWAGTEEGRIPYPCTSAIDQNKLITGLATGINGDINGDTWAPMEVNSTLYDHFWFWSPEKELKRKSLMRLMDFYYKSIGRGGVMLLNSTPNTEGLIPEADVERYKELGEEIKRRFDKPIVEQIGGGREIKLEFPKAQGVNHVVIDEMYSEGERIRSFVIQVRVDNQWQTVYSGSIVGRKHIAVFKTILTDSVKMIVNESVGEPLIKKISVYEVADVDIEQLVDSLNDQVNLYDGFNRNPITKWSLEGERLYLNLTEHITMPKQYELKLGTDQSVKFREVYAIMDGNICDYVVQCMGEDRFIITRTAMTTNETTAEVVFILEEPNEMRLEPTIALIG